MEVKKDLLSNIPKIGDLVVFNPPRYKGLTIGTIQSFTSSGLPEVIIKEGFSECSMYWEIRKKGVYSIKTDFLIIKDEL